MMDEQDENVVEVKFAGGDDLTVITGIGAGVEKRLRNAGIHTYLQLAALSAEEIAEALNGMIGFSAERISELDWIGEARELATQTQGEQVEEATNHQRYAVFTLEFLMDKDYAVRRTKVMHVQSQHEESWAGWDNERLMKTMIQRAGLSVEEGSKKIVEQPVRETAIHEAAPVIQTAAPAKPNLAGEFYVTTLQVRTTEPGKKRWSIESNQPITLRLDLDLAELERSKDAPINYLAEIYAKDLNTGTRQRVGSSKGKLLPNGTHSIDVECRWLSRGTHRLDAFVVLAPGDREPQLSSKQVAFLDGGLFQVN